MGYEADTDSGVPWNPRAEEPFTPEELRRLRKLLAEDAHATWLRKKIRVFTPWAVAFVGGCITVYNFVMSHWKGS